MIKVGDKVVCNWPYGVGEDAKFNKALGVVTSIFGAHGQSCVVKFDFSNVQSVFSMDWLYLYKPISVGEHRVEFKDNGNIKVGCTEVDFQKLEEIYLQAKENKKKRNIR